jgi:23S rRNA-/tRNA-specific pseudouridylate synthase
MILNWIIDNLKTDAGVKKFQFGYGLLNRLDVETSGIIMIAKNLKSYNKYRNAINDHIKTTKIYLALVNGDTLHEFGVIELPLYIDEQKRMTIVDKKRGKFSYTEYVKLQTLEYKGKIYSLLLVKIKTGRTHQIRVHLKSIGHTIVCDKKYEFEHKLKLKEQCDLSSRLFLHAQYYKIDNDVDGYIKIPVDLDKTLNKLKIIKKNFEYSNAFEILKSNIITNNFLNIKSNSF